MTVLHPFRRVAAIVAACAVLALGVVALVASQSQPARAASSATFTMTPSSGRLSDAAARRPVPSKSPGQCPDVTVERPLNFNSFLNLYVVKAARHRGGGADGDRQRGALHRTDLDDLAGRGGQPGDGGHATCPDIITGDGTYELRVCSAWTRSASRRRTSTDCRATLLVPEDHRHRRQLGGRRGRDRPPRSRWTPVAPTLEPDQDVTLTATVTPADVPGTVTFVEGDTTLGTARHGRRREGRVKTTTLAEGSHDIIARFTPTNTAEWARLRVPCRAPDRGRADPRDARTPTVSGWPGPVRSWSVARR